MNQATTCSCCKLEIHVHEQPGYRSEHCSEFCASVSDEDKEKFLKLQPGEFGLWPCPDCGCAIEDEYNPKSCCGDCGEKRKIARAAFKCVRINVQAKLDTLVNSGMPAEAILLLVIQDLERFSEMTHLQVLKMIEE